MKTSRKRTVILIAPIIFALLLVLLITGNKDEVNNSYALIDKAIKDKNPALCASVQRTTRPGPTDGPMEVSGQEAVDWCKFQVEQGRRVFGG